MLGRPAARWMPQVAWARLVRCKSVPGGCIKGYREAVMGKRVLVVDDEPNIVMSLEFLMRRAGFEVAVARNAREALDALEGSAPDLLLLDVMMPEFDGYEVCERIRARPEWSGTKIVMLTARGRDVERERGLALGADAYVTKPFSTRDLVDQVKRMLA